MHQNCRSSVTYRLTEQQYTGSTVSIQEQICEIRCAVWYHLFNFKNVKNTHGRVLHLLKLQANSCNFNKSNTPPWVLFTFFKLYKWYHIAQGTTYDKTTTRSAQYKETINQNFFTNPCTSLKSVAQRTLRSLQKIFCVLQNGVKKINPISSWSKYHMRIWGPRC